MFVKFSFIIKFVAVAVIIGGLTFTQSPASAQPLPPGIMTGSCPMSESGSPGNPPFLTFALEMPAGSTLTVVMTTTNGTPTAIAVISLDTAAVLLTSDSDKSFHTASYTATQDTVVVLAMIWISMGSPQNTYTVTISGCGEDGEAMAGPPAGNLLDGRLNNSQLKDVAAPVAIYCADGNINIWKINAETGEGTLIITTPQVEGTPEGGNTELASAEGVSLYWLEGGQYQINTPNFEGILYSITWEGCDSSTLVHLAPQP